MGNFGSGREDQSSTGMGTVLFLIRLISLCI